VSEFSLRPFVAGSLIGIRSFKADALGRLTGVSVPQIWLPGENVAVCRKDHGNPVTAMLQSFSFTIAYSCTCSLCAPVKPALETAQRKTRETAHDVGSLSCGCGFYAYFDHGANPYHATGQLHGLIEGYGVVTVGTRGFRCEKAKLLALIIKPKHETAATDAVRRNYPDAQVFPSRRAALERFPLTQPDPITPENTPDFWECSL